MILNGTEDLRVQKTVRGIKNAFKSLLCERETEDISVKELCEKAAVNKKTFYHYYKSINELLAEIQMEYALDFLKGVKDYVVPEELGALNQDFFLYADRQGDAFCHVLAAYPQIDFQPIINVLKERLGWNKSPQFQKLTNYEQNFVLDFTVYSVLNACRQWMKDGKSMPLKRVIAMTNKLIEGGVQRFF